MERTWVTLELTFQLAAKPGRGPLQKESAEEVQPLCRLSFHSWRAALSQPRSAARDVWQVTQRGSAWQICQYSSRVRNDMGCDEDTEHCLSHQPHQVIVGEEDGVARPVRSTVVLLIWPMAILGCWRQL